MQSLHYIYCMKKTTFVAILLLFTSQCFSTVAFASAEDIESEWAAIYYSTPKSQQEAAYSALLAKTEQLLGKNPESTDYMYWKAVILASRAEKQDGFSALKAISEAKDLLVTAIDKDPKTANGSAYVVLGTLYHLVPKWPIAFGDNVKAKQMFLNALKINPDGIDTNYFYGDYLLANNEVKEAQQHFEKALFAPSRKNQEFADNKLKDEVKLALHNAKNRKVNSGRNAFFALFNSASLK